MTSCTALTTWSHRRRDLCIKRGEAADSTWEFPAGALLDIGTKCCVRRELDSDRVASSLPNTDEVVDVDMGKLCVLWQSFQYAVL